MQNIKKNDQSKSETFDENNINEQIHCLVDDNSQCIEIKVQFEDNQIRRYITTETIPIDNDANIEKICRQYANQDVIVKIRNGKKITIERTKIIKP